jgi:hypothetical protein
VEAVVRNRTVVILKTASRRSPAHIRLTLAALVAALALALALALAACGDAEATPTTAKSVKTVALATSAVPGSGCYTGGHVRAVVTPGTVRPNQLVSFSVVGDKAWTDLVTGMEGAVVQYRSGAWEKLFAVFVGLQRVAPGYAPWKPGIPVYAIGLAGRLTLKVPPLAAGVYSIQFNYGAGQESKLWPRSVLLCANVRVA